MNWLEELTGRVQGLLAPAQAGVNGALDAMGDGIDSRAAAYAQEAAAREAQDRAWRAAQMADFYNLMRQIRERGLFFGLPQHPAPAAPPAPPLDLPIVRGMIPGVSGARKPDEYVNPPNMAVRG